MNFLYLILFSVIPSLIWLAFFLREDPDPEPRRMLLKVFLAGVAFTLPVVIIGLLLEHTMKSFGLPFALVPLIGAVAIAPITEELFKYLVLKLFALKSSALDQPPDLMIYAITAALGFAAMENIVFLLPGRESLLSGTPFLIQEMMMGSVVRFVSGTFLHALASGIMAYFFALTLRSQKKTPWLGIAIAILLHGFYNFSIMTAESAGARLIIPPILLISMLITLLALFAKTRRMKSVCLLKNQR